MAALPAFARDSPAKKPDTRVPGGVCGIAVMAAREERAAAREWGLDLARADSRIQAAEVRSAAQGGGDRWSDLDLAFVEDLRGTRPPLQATTASTSPAFMASS
jgi:hypothetical protein